MPFSRRKMYTLQPGATASSQSSRSRFKVMKKKLTRRYRRPHSFRYPRHRPLVSTDSMVLHELVPSLPMPSEQELNLKFIAMVVRVNSLNVLHCNQFLSPGRVGLEQRDHAETTTAEKVAALSLKTKGAHTRNTT